MELMDDEMYGLRQAVSEQERTIRRLETEIERLRTLICDPHDPVLGGDFVWRCARCSKWLPED